MKVGVIGFGSIGKRHCQNLLSYGIKDITLFRELGKGNRLPLDEMYVFEDFVRTPFDFIILANPTAFHFKYLKQLLERNINVLVEKPVVSNVAEYKEIKKLLKAYSGYSMVAYNMRFHPVTKRVKEILKKNTLGKVYSARFFVGQYLPDWRPDIDYRKSYSSKKELGGGVVLDLSHEIDLARFFFGNVESNFHGISQKVSNLEINTEDLAEVHYISESNTLVSIHMDYLVQGYSRHFEIIGEKASVFGDFYNNTVMVVGKNNTIIEKVSYENFSRNSMYVELMESYIRSYGKNRKSPIDIYDGLEILKIALMIKNSSI